MFHTPTRSKPKSPSETIPEINHIRHQAYGGWLHRHFRQQKRASLKPYTFRIISYRRVPVVRKFGTPPILDPDVTCRGNLIVENPEHSEQLITPLFLGRKTCLPSAYLFQGLDTGSQSPLQALLSLPALPETEPTVRLLWSRGETAGAPDDLVPSKTYRLSDERDFQSGPHKGFRWVSEALIDAARLPSKSAAPLC